MSPTIGKRLGLASLNHPNIAAIHGVEELPGGMVLVLEPVDGPTLSDRVRQGPIPLEEALPIAKQIAEALEAGHYVLTSSYSTGSAVIVVW